MNKYVISLTPMGSFYFGGERSFSVGENDKSELASYIVESNKFPQQTSLLGMLRFWILKNSKAFSVAENKIINSKIAISIIGKKSFSINTEPFNEDNESRFGKIRNVGFCFLQRNECTKNISENWINILPTPLDYGLEIDFNEGLDAFYNGKPKILPTIRYIDKKDKNKNKIEYSSKEGLVKGYIDGNKNLLQEDDIFIKDQRIGIDRNIKTGKTEDNALYKQIFYRLADGFRFAFIAEFEDGFTLPQEGQIVELGGDSSKFVLNYEVLNVLKEPCYENNILFEGKHKIILLSDTKIDNSVVEEYAMFSITDHTPFRFLSFNVETASYSRKFQKDNVKKRYSLFKRGSVFYFESEEKLTKFEAKINENECFQQIGYNKYK